MNTIKHAVVITGSNNGAKQVSKDAWNDDHEISDFGEDSANHSGLTYAYFGGTIREDNVIYTVAAGTVALADNDVSYIEWDSAGGVTDNIVGFTSGSFPIAEVTTAGGAITVVTDKRVLLTLGGGGGAVASLTFGDILNVPSMTEFV
jgi:hypothetical protein